MLNLHYLLRYLLSRLQLGTQRTLQKCHVKKLDQQRYSCYDTPSRYYFQEK